MVQYFFISENEIDGKFVISDVVIIFIFYDIFLIYFFIYMYIKNVVIFFFISFDKRMFKNILIKKKYDIILNRFDFQRFMKFFV